jgi:hypothetical protein
MKQTIITRLQHNIADLMCKAYDLGKNDGTLKELTILIHKEIYNQKYEDIKQ